MCCFYENMFSLYGKWELLTVCKRLPRGTPTISTPGKPHSENFQKSPEVEKWTPFLKMSGAWAGVCLLCKNKYSIINSQNN